MPSRGDARADAEVGSIIGPAWAWRWQAPELALVFGERALRTAEQRGDQLAGLWAQTLIVSASCRLGQQLAVVDKAIEALRLSERLADDGSGAILRVELAGCARSAGVPLVGAGLLRPVLSATDVRPSVRAAALIQLAGCLAYSERHRELDGALAEADQLYADDREFDQDTRLGLRAVLRSFVAREHRRRGDLRSALHAAEEGANLLDGLSDSTADGGASARISLQQVLGLLDLGWVDQAATVAAGALSGPVRAHSAAAVGWLALAISTRVQLPAGLIEPAMALLQEITSMAERHHRDALHAESLSALSEAHELAGELAETLDYLRSAQVIRARRSRMLRAARGALLGEFGEARNPDGLLRLLNPASLNSTLSTGRRTTADRDTPLFGQSGDKPARDTSGITLVLIDVAKTRSGMSPGARGPMTAGSVGPGAAGIGTWTAESLGAGARAGEPIAEGVLRKVVEHLRDLTPAEAAVARVGGAELAVLLPGTSRSQVERWAEELRAAMADVDWGQVAPGLTINVRTVVTEVDQSPLGSPQRATNAPASGIALDAQPTRVRRSGELTSPRLPIPTQPEPDRAAAMVTDQPVPPARTPAETTYAAQEQPTGRRARGTLPSAAEQQAPEPMRTPLPQASWSGLLSPQPESADETARRRHAASQEPTQRWKPVWLPADEESDTGRWLLDPAAKPEAPEPRVEAQRAADAPTGLDRFGLGGMISTGRRRAEDAQPAAAAGVPDRSPEPVAQSTPDSGRRRAEEAPPAEPGSRHSAQPVDANRSVLDSLGISAGSGGRRRAPEATDPAREPAPPVAPPSEPASSDSEPTGRRARRDYGQPPLAGLIPTVEPSSGGRRRADDTIPKIRLPQPPSSTSSPAPAGFPGAAFPGSGFAGLNPQAAPDPTPPTGFAAQRPPAGPLTGQTPAPAMPFGLPPTGSAQASSPQSGSVPFGSPPFGTGGSLTGGPRRGGPATGTPAMGAPATGGPGTGAPHTGAGGFASFDPASFGPAPTTGSVPPTGWAPAASTTADSADLTPPSGFALPVGSTPIPPAFDIGMSEGLPRIDLSPRPADDGRTASGYLDLSRISSGNVERGSGYYFGQPSAETSTARAEPAPAAEFAPPMPQAPAVEPASPGHPTGDVQSTPGVPSTRDVQPIPGVQATFGVQAAPSVAPAFAGEAAAVAEPAPAAGLAFTTGPAPTAEPASITGSGSVAGSASAVGPAATVEPVLPAPPVESPVAAGDGAEGGSSFSALSEFSAMLARFDDPVEPSALALPEPPTTPVRPKVDEAAALPEPEPTPRAERSSTAQPFAPETMFASSSEPKPEVKEALRPSPPPSGIAAKLDVEPEPDVASISGRGRRRSPKLGDLLTEALRAYQDVRDADEAQDSLATASEPRELGATELSSWLGTGTEPLGSIDPPSWRPGSSTRSFGVARHSSGDDSAESRPDWNPPAT